MISLSPKGPDALPSRFRALRDRGRRHPRPVDVDASRAKTQGARQDSRRAGCAHRRARQDRHRCRRVGDRVRRRAQQLLPAGDARADVALRFGLGERRGDVQLSPGGLHADQPRGHAHAGARNPRAATCDRLRVGVRRRRGGIDALHEGTVRRLAGEEHHVGAAREARRLRQQHGVAARSRRQGKGARRRDRRRRRGDGAAQ
jgi:hypothetical protein